MAICSPPSSTQAPPSAGISSTLQAVIHFIFSAVVVVFIVKEILSHRCRGSSPQPFVLPFARLDLAAQVVEFQPRILFAGRVHEMIEPFPKLVILHDLLPFTPVAVYQRLHFL